MKDPTRDELRQRLLALHGYLQIAESADFRSLGVFDEGIADGDAFAEVEGIVLRRAEIVAGLNSQMTCSSGKLLLLYLDENLIDGAAAVTSRGFFCGLNFPPCDLWLAVVEGLCQYGGTHKRTLISWVPESSIARAQFGIDVNPEECLEWAAEGAPGLCELAF